MKLSQKERKLLKFKVERQTSFAYSEQERRKMHEQVFGSARIAKPKKGKGSFVRSKNKLKSSSDY